MTTVVKYVNHNMCVPAVSLDKVTSVIRMQDVKIGDIVTLSNGFTYDVLCLSVVDSGYSVGLRPRDASAPLLLSLTGRGIYCSFDTRDYDIVEHTSVVKGA